MIQLCINADKIRSVYFSRKCFRCHQSNIKCNILHNKYYCYWDIITKTVEDDEITLTPYYGEVGTHNYAQNVSRGWSSVALKNHPLVESGDAFWYRYDTLLCGYTLKNNPAVFRPIFSPTRDKNMLEIRKYIVEHSDKIRRWSQQNLVRKELLCIRELPLEIVILISSWF